MVACALLYGVVYRLAHLKIHIGDPQRLQVGSAKMLLQTIVFNTLGAFPGHYLVEIHIKYYLYVSSYCKTNKK